MENQNTESQTVNAIPTPSNSPIQIPAQKNNDSVIILLCLVITLLVGVSTYLYGVSQGKKVSEPQSMITPKATTAPILQTEIIQPTTSEQSKDKSLGSTDLFYAEIGADIYLKQVISFTNDKVQYPNSKSRTITTIYSQDESFEPKIVMNIDDNKYIWTKLVQESIIDSLNSKSILVSDRLFSLKKIPNTSNFIFVQEWERKKERY